MDCMYAQTGLRLSFSSETAVGSRVRTSANFKGKIPFTVGLNTGWLICFKISPFEGWRGGGGATMPFTVGLNTGWLVCFKISPFWGEGRALPCRLPLLKIRVA